MTVEAILVVIMLASGVFGLWVDQRDLARERELREQAAICAEATGAGDAMSIDCSAPADRARDVDEAGASSRAEKVQPEEGHQVALPGRGENEPPSLVSPSTPVVRMPAHPAERSHSPEAFKFNVSDFPFSWYVELVRRRITEK